MVWPRGILEGLILRCTIKILCIMNLLLPGETQDELPFFIDFLKMMSQSFLSFFSPFSDRWSSSQMVASVDDNPNLRAACATVATVVNPL